MKKVILTIALLIAFPLAFLEGLLRVYPGYPSGVFKFLELNPTGGYAPNQKFHMKWGPIPYTIVTNNLGFRSQSIASPSPNNVKRVALIGDSVTDGFFVDNDDSYPVQLKRLMQEIDSEIEIVPLARGGGSIGEEFAKLKANFNFAEPKEVVLTFVTNDISDLKGRSKLQLQTLRPDGELKDRLSGLFLSRSSIGELLGRIVLGRFKDPMTIEGKDRYNISGGSSFDANVKLFKERFKLTDGMVHSEPFSEETYSLITLYLEILGELKSFCDRNNAKLIFVYTPSYQQIYDSHPPLQIRDLLAKASSELGIKFYDTTNHFRDIGRAKIIHLAPVDFHFNPDGNAELAKEVLKALAIGKRR